jgi:tRNA threonylcarbamoyl adenosine modification protein YeaZ
MNKILCFDTSSNSCSVSVSVGEEILAFEQELRPSMQAESLMVMIESSLKTAKMSYNDLDFLAVTVGPGSFTGIRVALAAARGIMHATGVKGVAITNFEAAYYRLCKQTIIFDKAIIIINAYRNQQYIQIFDARLPASHPQLVDNKDIPNIIKACNGVVACAGSGLSALYNDIKEIDNLLILPRFANLKATHIARLAHHKIQNNQIDTIEPLYIRPPDAIAN